MSAIAAIVRQRKEKYPADYCAHPDCLWRIVTRHGSSPCPKHAAPPRPGMSAYASDLHARLEFQTRVNGILLATTRQQSRGPLLTEGEMQEMETAFALGLTADGLAARFMARDKTRGAA